MSSKKQKELRKFMKKMSIELDRNEELYEKLNFGRVEKDFKFGDR